MTFLRLLLFVLVLENLEAKKCNAALKVEEALGHGKAELYRDFDAKTTYFFWGRLRKIFDATDAASVEDLFSNTIKTPEELENLHFLIQTGEVKVDSHTAHLIEDLYLFMDQQAEKKEKLSFWDTPNRLFNIQEALKKDEGERGYDNSPEVAATHTRLAMDRSTRSLLTRALAEHRGQKFPNSKWYDGWRRWFRPHHARTVKMLGTLRDWEKSLVFIYKGDEPMYDALARYKAELNADEASIIKGQVEATGEQFEEIRAGIGSLYGREIGTVHEINRAEVNLWEMEKRLAKAKNVGGTLSGREREVEGELDHLDTALARNFKRRHEADPEKVPEIRPKADYHESHLRIRNSQYARETPELKAEYYRTGERRPLESDYTVRANWTYTVSYMRTVRKTRQVSDGKGGTKTESYTSVEYSSSTFTHDARTFTLHTDYNEVIDGKIVAKESEVESQLPSPPAPGKFGWITVGSSNNAGSVNIRSRDEARIAWILDEGKRARAVENPRRQQINEGIEIVDGIVEGYPKNIQGQNEKQKHEAVLSTLDKLRAELIESQQKILEEYHQWGSNKVKGQWTQDKPEDFKKRNSELNHRYLHLIKRIEHLREQVLRKQEPLIITYTDLPNYEPQIAELDRIRHRIRVQQGVLGGVAAALLGGGIYYANNDEEVDEWLRQKGLLKDRPPGATPPSYQDYYPEDRQDIPVERPYENYEGY